jgi:hypothetical protein
MPDRPTRRRWPRILLLLAVAAAALYADQRLAAQPAWPPARSGDPQPQRSQADDPPFSTRPIVNSYAERRQLYLDYVSALPTPDERGGIFYDLVRLQNGQRILSAAALDDALAFVNAREDTADFTMAGLIRLYYQQAGHGVLTADQEERLKQSILHFKYWLDEPNPTYMELWTENHQILAFSAEYLAGQAFPDEIFANNGQTGAWHMQHGREKLLRWIDFHARTGMAEWDSVPYYDMDFAALLNLVDFSGEPEVALQARMMADVLFYDMAADSFYGQYATSHGRAAARHVKSAAGDSLITLQALAWGTGRFQGVDMASAALATSPSYQVPAVIQAIAQDHPEEVTSFERQSIPLTDQAAAQYGLSFQNAQDVEIWWGMEAFTQPKVIDLTIHMADAWGLWHSPDFADLKDLAQLLQKAHLLAPASALLAPDSNGAVLSEVNKVTFRTPDYQLSNAQDYRKGEKGYQQHIWQATLGPYAVVFATNPDGLREDDSQRPSYWASDGRLPRSAQYLNVLVSLWNIDRYPSPSGLEARHYAFTHAYFPRWAFDEVREEPAADGGGWIFGRKGDGYVALYSHQPYQWQGEGPDAGQEIIALGRQNVWICQMGRAAVDGSFDDFVAHISQTPLDVQGLSVRYAAPGVGQMEFGWNDSLLVDGREAPLRGYARFSSPYAVAPFGAGVYHFELGEHSLDLNFAAARRLEN